MENGKTALGLDKNVGGLLCYMPLCGINIIYSIIVLVTDKENRDMRFHALQSLLLSVVLVVGIVVVNIFGTIVSVAVSQILGLLISLAGAIVILAWLILTIIGCIKAFQGQEWKAPVVGGMADGWAG